MRLYVLKVQSAGGVIVYKIRPLKADMFSERKSMVRLFVLGEHGGNDSHG